MKLISDLNVNGNIIKNAAGKNIGQIVEKMDTINASQINSLDALRGAILGADGKVPAEFTFQDFITALVQKVNAEVKSTHETAPTISVSSEVTGQTSNLVVEVGAAAASYSLVHTATAGEMTPGTGRTHAITMGKSTDSYEEIDLGCAEGDKTWNGDNATNVITKSCSFATPAVGEQASRESHTLTVGEITLTQAYGASTKELDMNGVYLRFHSSYGKALYDAVGRIVAGSCSATTSKAKSVVVKTEFYSWDRGSAALGDIVKESWNQAIVSGSSFVFPADKALGIRWKVLGSVNTTNDQMYSIATKYIALPCGGTCTLLDEAPADQAYMKYAVVTLNGNIPENITNASILIKSENDLPNDCEKIKL